jgi:uncharacterized membrane protein
VPHLRLPDIALAVALLASVVMLGPALAHAFELPNKIDLARDQYFIVQQIYRGWDRFALVLLLQVIALVAAAWLTRRQRQVARPIAGALLCVIAAQILFWTYTFPANAATRNWTVQTADWETLREHWEYSHLAGAVLQLAGILSLIVAVAERARAVSRAPG